MKKSKERISTSLKFASSIISSLTEMDHQLKSIKRHKKNNDFNPRTFSTGIKKCEESILEAMLEVNSLSSMLTNKIRYLEWENE